MNSPDLTALVASNAIEVLGTPRRTIVSNEACNTCHEDRYGVFNKHGANRHNDVAQCALCHNNNSPDWERRQRPVGTGFGQIQLPPSGTLADEHPSDLMTLVHKLHSGDPGYALPTFGGSWSTWEKITYPTSLANCTQCHVGDTFYPVSRALAPRGVSFDSNNGASDVNTHRKISAGMAACSSCHTDPVAMAHMTQNGGVIDKTQPEIDASHFETCATCHGPGRTADVKKVHGLN